LQGIVLSLEAAEAIRQAMQPVRPIPQPAAQPFRDAPYNPSAATGKAPDPAGLDRDDEQPREMV
jgi:hypothetical protein